MMKYEGNVLLIIQSIVTELDHFLIFHNANSTCCDSNSFTVQQSVNNLTSNGGCIECTWFGVNILAAHLYQQFLLYTYFEGIRIR